MGEGAQYSFILDGQQMTVGWNELVQLAREGRLTPVNPVTLDSGAQVAAQDIPGLFAAPQAPPVAPPMQSAPPPGSPYKQPAPTPPIAGASFEPQFAPPPKKGFPTWVIVLMVVGIFGCGCCFILAAILFPVFSQAKVAAKQALNLSNLRQINLGTMMYATDWDDKYPLNMSSATAVEPAISVYVKNPQVFAEVNPAGGSYLGDARLNGLLSDQLVQPSSVLMFYDEVDWSGGHVCAVYADGHATKVQRFDISQALATPIDLDKSATGSNGGGAAVSPKKKAQ